MEGSKFIFCPFVARLHVSLWLDLDRFRLRLLPLCSTRIAQAPAYFLLRVLFRIAVRWQRARRINRPVAHSADFKVRLVVTEELFPVFYALSRKPSSDHVETHHQRCGISLFPNTGSFGMIREYLRESHSRRAPADRACGGP
jgi:hypothetical protein